MVKERRSYFRVDIIESLQAVARLVSINGTQAPVQKLIEMNIRDLSAGGMKIEMTLDLPINMKIVIKVSFDFEDQHFDVEGFILRKKFLAGNLKEYGIRFIGVPLFEENRLVRCLNQYNIKKVKAKKSQIDPRKQKGIGLLVKVMEALDVPAYLVTTQRIVIAANRVAVAKGARVGERCYQTICKNNKICPYCLIDDAPNNDDVICTEAIVQDVRQSVNWIYLENGLTLHYLKKEG